MANLPITASRNLSGKLQGSYVPILEGVNFIGTVGHGNTLTITDSLGRFGTRTNVKPLFVNFGDSRFGSSLGRITTTHISPNAVSDTVVKLGGMASSWKLDIRQFGDSGIIGTPVTTQDQTKPLIQYIERRYGFDYADPTIQNNGYYFNSPPDANIRLFSLSIDGRTYSHTNDGSPASANNASAVAVIIAAQINSDLLCKCTAVANDGTFDLRLTKKNMGDTFSPVLIENLYQNFNNKTARIYSWNDSTPNDAYMISAGSGAGSSHTNMENTSGSANTPDYNAKQETSLWMSEELVLKNSSAGGVSDGFYNHYKNGELLNTGNSLVTYNVGQQPLGRCYLTQFSNGPYGYWRADLPINVGYQCWDDEYLGIYFADSETIAAGTTKLVRQPQATWSSEIVRISQVGSHVAPAGAYVHLRTGLATYIYLGRLPV